MASSRPPKSEERRAVVGLHQKGARTSPNANVHARGFGQALENALKGAKDVFYPDDKTLTRSKPATIDITVTFEATASVWNPGVIDQYRAIITPVD
jgi:hypothetical protein